MPEEFNINCPHCCETIRVRISVGVNLLSTEKKHTQRKCAICGSKRAVEFRHHFCPSCLKDVRDFLRHNREAAYIERQDPEVRRAREGPKNCPMKNNCPIQHTGNYARK